MEANRKTNNLHEKNKKLTIKIFFTRFSCIFEKILEELNDFKEVQEVLEFFKILADVRVLFQIWKI